MENQNTQPQQSIQPPSTQQSLNPPSTLPTQNANTPSLNMIITILLLLFFFPLGLFLMWFWTHWPKWLKIILTILLIISTLLFGIIISSAGRLINDTAAIETYEACMHQCAVTTNYSDTNPDAKIEFNACKASCQ